MYLSLYLTHCTCTWIGMFLVCKITTTPPHPPGQTIVPLNVVHALHVIVTRLETVTCHLCYC